VSFVFLHARLQGQVDEVVGIMKDNVGRVIDRGDRLEDLQDKSGISRMPSLLHIIVLFCFLLVVDFHLTCVHCLFVSVNLNEKDALQLDVKHSFGWKYTW